MHWPHSTTVPLLELKRIHFHIVLELLKERERERERERDREKSHLSSQLINAVC